MPHLVVVIPVEPIPTSFAAVDWPLHVTLSTNFSTDATVDVVDVALRTVTQGVDPFEIRPGPDRMFGPAGDVPVVEVLPRTRLDLLHRRIRDQLGEQVEWTTPHHGTSYRPHCTVQGPRRLDRNHRVSELVLVDLRPDGDRDRRQVVSRLALGA